MMTGDSKNAIADLKKALAGDPSPVKVFSPGPSLRQSWQVEDARKILHASKIKGWKQSGLHRIGAGRV